MQRPTQPQRSRHLSRRTTRAACTARPGRSRAACRAHACSRNARVRPAVGALAPPHAAQASRPSGGQHGRRARRSVCLVSGAAKKIPTQRVAQASQATRPRRQGARAAQEPGTWLSARARGQTVRGSRGARTHVRARHSQEEKRAAEQQLACAAAAHEADGKRQACAPARGRRAAELSLIHI